MYIECKYEVFLRIYQLSNRNDHLKLYSCQNKSNSHRYYIIYNSKKKRYKANNLHWQLYSTDFNIYIRDYYLQLQNY